MQHRNGCAASCVGVTNYLMEVQMPRGAYTAKQDRKAEHIEEGYEKRGVSKKEAEERAWRTVNAQDEGGKKSGSGRGKARDTSSSRKGGAKGGLATPATPRIALGGAKEGLETPPKEGERLSPPSRPTPRLAGRR